MLSHLQMYLYLNNENIIIQIEKIMKQAFIMIL